jgi:hypothetical protein
MNVNEIKRTSRQIARVLASVLPHEWDRIRDNAKGDPKGLGVADVNVALKISTTGQGNHVMKVTIPGRAYKEDYTVTPTDMELPEEEGDFRPDPGEPVEP